MTKLFKFILSVVIIFIVSFIIFRNIPFKSNYLSSIYDFIEPKQDVTGNIKLSVPKFSFGFKENYKNDTISITFKNIRSNRIIKKEIKIHISDYQIIKCKGKEFYYDIDNGYTLIEYKIKNNYIYSVINYKIIFGNYCN